MTRVDHAKVAPRSVKAVYALEFRISEVPPSSVLLIGVVVVSSVEGSLCTAQARCTHRQGPSTEGPFDRSTVPCPLHGLQLNVANGRRAASPGVGAEDLPRDGRQRGRAQRHPARTCCPKRVTYE